jgi:hypothetical protein
MSRLLSGPPPHAAAGADAPAASAGSGSAREASGTDERASGEPTFSLRDGLARLVGLVEESVLPTATAATSGSPRANERGCCVLVDDLGLLTDVGVPLADVLWFVSELRRRFACGHASAGAVVLLCHATATDPTDEDDEEEGDDSSEGVDGGARGGGSGGSGANNGAGCNAASLARHLRYHADVTLDVSALRTGYSREVHGQVTLTEVKQGAAEPTTTVLQYKTRDSGVSFFAPGTSSAVL